MFNDVFVPQAVLDELKAIDNPVFKEKAITFFSARVKSITQINNLSLLMDYGESEAVILYKELNADFLLIDDKHARQIAESLQVNCIGTLGILIIAKEKGFIKKLHPYFRDLIKNKRYFSLELLNNIHKKHGEKTIR